MVVRTSEKFKELNLNSAPLRVAVVAWQKSVPHEERISVIPRCGSIFELIPIRNNARYSTIPSFDAGARTLNRIGA